METSVRAHRSFARGCYSETGHLRKVVMCPPTFFRILEPINAVQLLYYSDGLPKPEPLAMVQQHQRLVDVLRTEGVEIELLPPRPDLPYQHATRDVGVVIGDTIILSHLKEKTRRLETQIVEPILRRSGLRVLVPEQGYIEGGDIIVDNDRLWIGLGARTDDWGAEFLHQNFGRDYDVIPLRFDPQHTHLDTVLGLLGQGHALLYESAFEPSSLERIREVYPSVILLTDEEQENAGANVLCLSPDKVISIAENQSVNKQLVQLGYQVLTVPFSEVIKSGGSVRCDTLPMERDPVSLR